MKDIWVSKEYVLDHHEGTPLLEMKPDADKAENFIHFREVVPGAVTITRQEMFDLFHEWGFEGARRQIVLIKLFGEKVQG